MKIHGTGWFGKINPYQRNQNPKELSAEKRTQSQDEIKISPEAKALLEQHRVEETRREKIESLKKQIESGQYRVDAEKLAEKLMEWWKL